MDGHPHARKGGRQNPAYRRTHCHDLLKSVRHGMYRTHPTASDPENECSESPLSHGGGLLLCPRHLHEGFGVTSRDQGRPPLCLQLSRLRVDCVFQEGTDSPVEGQGFAHAIANRGLHSVTGTGGATEVAVGVFVGVGAVAAGVVATGVVATVAAEIVVTSGAVTAETVVTGAAVVRVVAEAIAPAVLGTVVAIAATRSQAIPSWSSSRDLPATS